MSTHSPWEKYMDAYKYTTYASNKTTKRKDLWGKDLHIFQNGSSVLLMKSLIVRNHINSK